jgi:DNA-binding response OmpR family regulator
MDTNWKHGTTPGVVATRSMAVESRLAQTFQMGSMMIPRPERVTCGPIEVDRASHRVTLGGDDLRLTERECSLLLCLADRANRVVRRSDVLSEVWGLPDDDSNLVAVYIRRLRQKLGKHAEMIVTVRGIGYRLRPSFDVADATSVQRVAS